MIINRLISATIALSSALLVAQVPVYSKNYKYMLVSKGYEQLAAGSYQAAVTTLVSALHNNPSDCQARRYLASALFYSGYTEKAAEQLEQVISLDPGKAIDLLNLGNAYFHHGNSAKAIEKYQKALQIDVNLNMARSGLAQVYLSLGELNKAQQMCLNALSYVGDNTSRQHFLALLEKVNKQILEVNTVAHMDGSG